MCTVRFTETTTYHLANGMKIEFETTEDKTEASTPDMCCMKGGSLSDDTLLMACVETTTIENETFTYDPAGQGTCMREYDAVLRNALSVKQTIIGAPISTSPVEELDIDKDECCKAGFMNGMDKDLLEACNMTPTSGDKVYTFDQAQGTCTYNIDMATRISLSDGTILGSIPLPMDPQDATPDACCMEGNTNSNSDPDLLNACEVKTTEEDQEYTWNPAGQGTCTYAFDEVERYYLSTGDPIGQIISSVERTEASTSRILQN